MLPPSVVDGALIYLVSMKLDVKLGSLNCLAV